MLRAQVLRRTFSLYNRVPYSRIAQSAARDGHESVTVHRVRISRPVVSNSRLVGTIAVAAAFWGLSRYISVEVEVEKADAKGQDPASPSAIGGATEEEEDDDDTEDILLFLPTGFSRPSPRTFYKGSDPEWQEFKKLATDRPRVEKIRNELIFMMRNMAEKNTGWTSRLGKIDTSKGKAWIELKFPDGPPPRYEQPGLALTGDLEWRKATHPVEDLHHQRLNKLLFPSVVSNALYADLKQKALLSWKSFKLSVGLEQNPKPRPTPVPGSIQDEVAKFVARGEKKPETTGVSATPAASSPPAAPAVNSTDAADPASSLSSQQAKELGLNLPDPKNFTLDLTKFQQEVKKSSKPYRQPPPRGSFLVMGLIDIYGEKARITLNVAAWYDPKQGRYVSIKTGIYNLVDHSQRPRGGP
ncbi:hypothetical protein HBI81_083440 [Parastagonospora nodorum]|nr:hypothetical protein HBH53_142730 [Parastagonospora nodorum]KAH3998242.1 hypothetical protein HBI10_130520 [Parastagonospora nodorum]KAH4030115.1 hypothetical protein HBI13_037060 [Parastagonospora nodorum]KAH4076534.1 hypothetical protein HBH50_006990 [Parastagonospora nodorum]KAH4095985.1 hypothetical protein HBH48_050800 [Parastagonospora nodorum]